MIGLLKQYLPISLYCAGLFVALLSAFGRPQLALWLIAFLYPLRNVIDKFSEFPLGQDFLDILIGTVIIGSLIHKTALPPDIARQKSPIHTMSWILIIYTYFSLWVGYFYLGYFDPLNTGDPRLQDCKNFILLPILYFVTFNSLKSKEDVWKLLYAILLGMFVANFYTGRQIVDHFGIESRRKITGTFVFLGPNEVAAYFNQYSMILIAMFFATKRKFIKGALGFLSFTNIHNVIFLFSRAAYIATWLGLFVYGAIRKRIFLIPLIALVIGWTVFLPPEVQQRITMTVDESGHLEASANTRIMLWEQATDLFYKNPIFGIGFHVFRELHLGAGDTHNIYFKILVEQGIFGILIFLILCLVFLREGWRLYKNADDDLTLGLGVGFFCCIIVMMVNNVFGNRWTHASLSGHLWMFAAMVARLNTLVVPFTKKNREEKTSQRNPIRDNQPNKKNKTHSRYIDVRKGLENG